MPNKFFFIVGLCMLVYFAPVKAIQSEAALKEFQSWFETLGGVAHSASLAAFPGMGVGLKSHGMAFDGFKLLDIPMSICIFDETIRANVDEEQGYAISAMETNEDKVAAFILLQLGLGAESQWAPYIKVLPVFVPNAVSWTKSNSSIPRDKVFADVEEAQHAFERNFAVVKQDLHALLTSVGRPELATLGYWRWARSIVDSRAFRIKGEVLLVPFADFFNFAPHAAAREQSQGNHFLKYHKVVGDSFIVYADRFAPNGEQLFEDYGDNSNEIYMMYHGFVAQNNPFSCWQFPLPQSSAIRRRGNRAQRTAVLQAVLGNARAAQEDLCLQPGKAISPKVYQAMYTIYASLPQLAKCKRFSLQPQDPSAIVECFGQSPSVVTVRSMLKRAISALKYTEADQTAFELDQLDAAKLSALRKAADAMSPGDDLSKIESELWQKQLTFDFITAKRTLIEGHVRTLRDELAALTPGQQAEVMSEGTIDRVSRSARLDVKEKKNVVAGHAASSMNRQETVPGTSSAQLPRSDLFAPRREPLPSVGIQDSTASPAEKLKSTVEVFNSWLASMKPAVLKIEAAVVGEGMRLGVTASSDIQPEEVYLSLPLEAIMSAGSAQVSNLKDTFVDLKRRFPRGDAYHELLFHLMYETFILGQNSTWAPYLATLPTSSEMGFPLFYSDRQLAQLQGMSIAASVRTNRDQLLRKFQGVKKVVFDEYPNVFTHEAFNWHNYLWAAAILDSRSIWWSQERHLVPLLDLINCKQGPVAARVHSTELDADGKNAITKAGWDFPVGSQVWENYGQPNHIYFAYHGFTMEPNAHDCAELRITPASLDSQAAERLTKLKLPEAVDGCLAVPSAEIQPRELHNEFGVSKSIVNYLVQALDTNEIGAMAALTQLTETELVKYHTTLEEDQSMLEQVLKTPTGDGTFIDVDEAIVRFRGGQKRLLRDWIRFSSLKLNQKFGHTALHS